MQPEARSAGAAAKALLRARVALRRLTERVPRRVLEVVVPDVQPVAAEVPSRAQVLPLAELSEPLRAEAEVVPSVRLRAEAEPWVPRREAVEEAQPGAQPGEAAAVQLSAERAAAEERRAAQQAAVVALRVEVPVVEAERRAAVPGEEQAQPSEARVERPSAVPSVRSGPQRMRAALARRRMTTAFRHKPALAQTERLRSQSSSAEGVECSS